MREFSMDRRRQTKMPCLSVSVGQIGGTNILLHPILFAKYMSVMSRSPMIQTLLNQVAPIIDRTSNQLNGFFSFVLSIYIQSTFNRSPSLMLLDNTYIFILIFLSQLIVSFTSGERIQNQYSEVSVSSLSKITNCAFFILSIKGIQRNEVIISVGLNL